ncbi:MAG: hypothetical protein U0936_11605 [Planctomycetaceae bacterium]
MFWFPACGDDAWCGEEVVHRSPQDIMDEIAALNAESAGSSAEHPGAAMKAGWKETTLGEAFATVTGNTPPKNNAEFYGDFMPLVKPPELCDSLFDSAEDGLTELGAAIARTLPPRSILGFLYWEPWEDWAEHRSSCV